MEDERVAEGSLTVARVVVVSWTEVAWSLQLSGREMWSARSASTVAA